MTCRLRRASERTRIASAWLTTDKSFSAEPADRDWRRFGPLLRLNEDRIAPGRGFATHPHANLEIVTVMLAGRLRHADALGGSGELGPGDVQHMSAGSGVEHSELNASTSEPVHLLQLWIAPRARALAPRYAQHHVALEATPNVWRELAGGSSELAIQQDAVVLGAGLEAGARLTRGVPTHGLAWLHVIEGDLLANGHALGGGDGMGLVDEPALELEATRAARVLVVVLAQVSQGELGEQRRRVARAQRAAAGG